MAWMQLIDLKSENGTVLEMC